MEQDALVRQLTQCLQSQVADYQMLLEVLSIEKQTLIGASTQDLNQLNKRKESLIQKIRMSERVRQDVVDRMSGYFKGLKKPVKLSELMTHLAPAHVTELKQMQLSLKVVVERIQECNRQNEVLVNSALRHVRGAIHSMREHLHISPTYKKEGGVQNGVSAGQLVSREA